MVFGRSAKIYGIIFGSTVAFLLIFAGATHFAYQKQMTQMDHEIMQSMDIVPNSYKHKTVHHHTVKRVIYGEKNVTPIDEMNSNATEKFWILLLKVDDYGLPLTVLALYDDAGLLKKMTWHNDHLIRGMNEIDSMVDLGIMNALWMGAEYVQHGEIANEKK